MFVRKITKLSRLGRFKRGSIRGGEYSKFTLFYGGNGRGKTTICAAFRSFQRNDPAFLQERTSFGIVDGPEVHMLLDSGLAQFSKGTWSASSPDLRIFDGHFISENVHDGENVETEHRRNFYRIAVGEVGVSLAQQLDALDEDISQKNSDIAAAKRLVQQHIPEGFTLEGFLELKEHPGLTSALKDATERYAAAAASAEVAAGKLLTTPTLPAIAPDFLDTLRKSLSDVVAEAKERMENHLASHAFGETGEQWIAQGMQYRRGAECPFCGGSVAENTLLAVYEGYFGESYAALKLEIDLAHSKVDQDFSVAAGLTLKQAYNELEEGFAFWRRFLAISLEIPAQITEAESAMKKLLARSRELTARKKGAPLEPLQPGQEWQDAAAQWEAVRHALADAVSSVPTLNEELVALKARTVAIDKDAALRALRQLEATSIRFKPAVAALCDELAKFEKEKSDLVDAKDATKTKLDAHDAAILVDHERSINGFLESFGASFRLIGSGKNYMGKAPQSVFGIQFEGHTVNVAAKAGVAAPSFRTTLSAGDKSTLALAFFLAQLARDTGLASRVVIFDDPFTSLDDFRREMTAKAIVRWGAAASQAIVFSHDKHFLDAVRRKALAAPWVAFQISVSKKEACVEPYDLEREVKEGYLNDHVELVAFADGTSSDARKAVVLMRPLLEKYIRYRFPNAIPDGVWLGEMLSIIHADASHPLASAYASLDEINGFTAPFHHDPNAPLNPDEVRTFAQRTLTIVGGS